MNELMGTIFFVLAAADPDPAWSAHAEADAFFCFTNLMSQLRDLFQAGLDAADSGIEGKIGEVATLLARHDPQLHAHMNAIGLNPHFFVLRWLTTLFSRELLLPDTVRVWDSMLAESPASLFQFVAYFAVSMILEQREALLAHDFGPCLWLLQNYPTTADMQALLQRAEALRQSDAGAGGGGGGSLPSKLRRVLAQAAVTVEDMKVSAAALNSLSAESRRAGAQIRSSFMSLTKMLVENLTVLDDSVGQGKGSKGSEGKGGQQPVQQRNFRPPPPAAGLSSSSSNSDDEEEDEEEGSDEEGWGRVGSREGCVSR